MPEASWIAPENQDEVLPGQWARERGTWQGTLLVRVKGRVAQKLKQTSNGEDPEANGNTEGELWVLTLAPPLAPHDLGLGAFPHCALVFRSVK